jgi:putative spermidine/putrescine transport system permease protein
MAKRKTIGFSKGIIYFSYGAILFPLLILNIWCVAGIWSWPHLLPETLSLRAFEELFGGYSGALKILFSSVALSVLVALLAVVVSISAARAIVLYKFYGKNLLRFLVLMPVIVPATAFAMGIHILFMKIGLNDSLPGVILVHVILCLPYTVRIMTEVTEAVGDKLEVQARVLGASPFQAFINITLPVAMPGILSAVCMAFIISFSQYFVTLLIGGGSVVTYAMFMFPYIQSGDRTIASAYSVLFVLATLLVFILLNRLVKKHYDIEDVFFFS